MSKYAHGLCIVAALAGMIVAVTDYFTRSSGIDHTGGALTVCVSTLALLVLTSILSANLQLVRGWRITLRMLCAIDMLATGVAALFLHAWWLLIFMVLAAIGWILNASPRATSQLTNGLQGMFS